MSDITVEQARKVIQQAFEDDPDFRRTYVDNIAMLLCDSQANDGFLNFMMPDVRRNIADRIVDLVFK